MNTEKIEWHISELISLIGENTQRQGLLDTPRRASKAWEEWFGGYSVDPKSLLVSFEDGLPKSCSPVIVSNIRFYSHCEHHISPFFGIVSVGYIPSSKIVGLSKIPRVVDALSRRLQVQERLTEQIGECIVGAIEPMACVVVVTARHLCVESRGVKQFNSNTTTVFDFNGSINSLSDKVANSHGHA